MKLHNFWCLLILTPSLAAVSEDFKTMLQKTVPLRQDGKIAIPHHIKHIKLDIGLSDHAPMSQYWLSHEDDLYVFGFEPNPTSVAAILQGTFSRHHYYLEKQHIGTNFFLFPCALGMSKETKIKFFVTANDCGCSSIYLPNFFPVEQIIEVPIFPLSDFFDCFPFDTHPVIDYIKIDAQGADLDIIKSAESYLKEKVIYITLEAEDSQYAHTNNSYDAIKCYMKSIGFIPYTSPNIEDPTYFNPRYTEYVKINPVTVYQHVGPR